MARDRREITAVCQRCGGSRGGTRYCPHCGLDFWKAAEESLAPTTAAAPPPAAVRPRSAGLGPGLIAVGAGISLLVVAAVVWLVAGSGLLNDRDTGRELVPVPPPAAHPLVLAFFSEARDPDAAYAWRQGGDVTVVVPDGEFATRVSAAGRAEGEDWAAKMRIVEDGEAAFDGEVMIVSQRGYVRTDGDAWVETGRIPASQLAPINPFARIATVGEVDYVGAETRDGVDGHVLTTDKWLSDPELDDPIRRIAHVRSREARMEIFVTADGVPLSALYTFELEARTPEGEIVTLTGTSRYSFEDWGAIEPIVAPSAEPAP